MASQGENQDEKRLQCQRVFRSYVDEFGYLPYRSEDKETEFVNEDGDILSVEAVESTTRYTGFAESFLGLPARMPEDLEYMEGYTRAQKRLSSRLLS